MLAYIPWILWVMAQVQLEHATCLLFFFSLSLSLDATESFRLVGLVLLVAVLCFVVQWA